MRKKTRNNILLLVTIAWSLGTFVACTNSDESGQDVAQAEQLDINGACEIYSINNSEHSAWRVRESPDWVTPVDEAGSASDNIQLYVESNNGDSRTGNVIISYANGLTRSVSVSQSNEQPAYSLQRAYAVGWGFDVRSYNDSRGLKDQIFNTEKVKNYDEDAWICKNSVSSDQWYVEGESSSELNNNITAKLNLNINYNAFSLDLKANFGMTALNNTKRSFFWLRGRYQERAIDLEVDPLDAANQHLFTEGFSNERNRVIEAIENGGNSDEAIRQLIDRYGTHYVEKSSLGGFLDYFYSCVITGNKNEINVDAAIKASYGSKFGLSANAEYKDKLEQNSEDKIEKFAVKGGNAVDLTNLVVTGKITDTDIEKWEKNMVAEEQFELLGFQLTPISALFPNNVQKAIEEYMKRMYYSDISVTRTIQ